MIHLRFAATPGEGLTYSLERLADGLFLGPDRKSWVADPAGGPPPPTFDLPETSIGRYASNIDATGFPDGAYCVGIHNARASTCIALLGCTLHNGDDGPTLPPSKATIKWES